jgi:hypothetical protein
VQFLARSLASKAFSLDYYSGSADYLYRESHAFMHVNRPAAWANIDQSARRRQPVYIPCPAKLSMYTDRYDTGPPLRSEMEKMSLFASRADIKMLISKVSTTPLCVCCVCVASIVL